MNFEVFLSSLARISVQAGVLVLLVLVVQWVFRRQLSPRWRCFLWAVVVARLVLPFSPGSATSIFNLIPRWEQGQVSVSVPTAAMDGAPGRTGPDTLGAARSSMPPEIESLVPASAPIVPVTPTMAQPGAVVSEQAAASGNLGSSGRAPEVSGATQPPIARVQARAISIAWNLFWIWLAGVVVLGGGVTVGSIRMLRNCRRLPPISDPNVVATADECGRRMGLRRTPAIVVCPAISSPALFGLFRPCLLLPEGFLGHFSEQELRFVLLHEMAHLRRRDLWMNWLVTILQVVHWFNPLLWLGFARWRADRELACDALALEKAGPDQNRDYGRTILHLLERLAPRSSSPGLVGILEDRRQLRRRIGMIAGFKPGDRWKVLSVALFAALVIVGLTDAKPQVTPRTSEQPTTAVQRSRPAATEEQDRVGADPDLAIEPAAANLELRTLTVSVLDANGQPLPGAEVEAPYLGDWKSTPPRRLTDVQGRFIVRYPMLPAEQRRTMTVFGIHASHAEFAPRAIMWTATAGDVYASIPSQVTLQLRRGHVAGGVVRDERGQPLANVAVRLSGTGLPGIVQTNLGPDRKTHEFPELLGSESRPPAAMTDASGRWQFRNFPNDLEHVQLTFVRPDHGRETFSTGGYDNGNTRPVVSMAELLAGTAVTTLQDGVTVRGIVLDSQGRPLPGATIKEGYGAGNIVRVAELRTDAAGRFEVHHRIARQWIYTASREDCATVSVIAQVERGMPEVRIVLPPAAPWKARVTDAMGRPVADATFTVDRYRTEGQILDWSGQSDVGGRVVWTNAPLSSATYYVASKALGAAKKVKVIAGATMEQLIVLDRSALESVTLRVKARDSANGEPVAVQSVSARFEGAGSVFKTRLNPGASECSVEIRRSEIRPGIYPSFELKVDATNYDSLITSHLDFDLGNQTLDLELRRTTGMPEVIVLEPGGDPASGTRLWAGVDANDGPLHISGPKRYFGDRLLKAQADDDGLIRLPSTTPGAPVVLSHDRGFLATTMAELQRRREVRLVPFGVVKGRLEIAGKAPRGATVSLTSLIWSPSSGYHVGYTATTGRNGEFEFTQVPPGEYKLYRWALPRRADTAGIAITETYQMPVVVTAGETSVVLYASKGRMLIGQAVGAGGEAVDWGNDVHTLTLKLPPASADRPPNLEDFATMSAFQKARGASDASRVAETGREQARRARTYALDFEPDGSFHIDDVPPGTYELRLRTTLPARAGAPGSFATGTELGTLTQEIVVSDGGGALDLGTLKVPLKTTLAASVPRAPVPAFAATTLEGAPLSLTQFKGTNVLLVFWAGWSERSREQLSTLPTLRLGMPKDARLVFLAASLDDSVGAARESIRSANWPGRHCWLDEKSRARLADEFDINALPAIYLLDGEGRLVARDLEGERLTQSITRLLAKK